MDMLADFLMWLVILSALPAMVWGFLCFVVGEGPIETLKAIWGAFN